MSREIMQQALDALEMHVLGFDGVRKMELAIEALETALAQPDETETLKRCLFQMQEAAKALAQDEQEPIAYLCENAVGYKYFRKKKPDNVYKPIALYTAPIKRPWLGLTSEDWENTPTSDKQGCERDAEMFDWVEQTLKDKNDVI